MTMSPDTSNPGKNKVPALPPGLYVVATPIGNLADITARAITVLRAADAIACEDKRVTAKLLHAHGIATPLLSYHDHNGAQMRPILLQRMREGQAIALVSDAGTPLIADPGFKLVRAAQDDGLAVHPLPGASAALAALSVSGLPTDRFWFEGFLPAKAKARQQALVALKDLRATLIFYESAQRTPQTLAAMAEIFGPREAVLARELTKQFETVRRRVLPDLAAAAAHDDQLKGEVVLLVAGATQTADPNQQLDALLAEALASLSTKEAAAAVSWTLNLPRRTVYQRALELNRDR
ncbi:MAG: 16S rRNA (cytidine(1402)-2'-O)-methyltransferase [Rhodothalassiaceae bacterium]